MSDFDYDLIVLGAGSGGVRCARISGSLGARVAVVESGRLGGTCVNLGCVPKKLYMTASRATSHLAEAHGFGWKTGEATLDWDHLREGIAGEVKRLNGIYGRLLDNAGVELIHGFGTLDDAHTVRVGDATYTAERILIATGGQPFVPPFEGHEHTVTSNALFSLRALPERIVIIGGGYIGIEFACIFRGCGAEVSVVNQTCCVLTAFDDDVREHMRTELERQGIALHLERRVARVEVCPDSHARLVHLDDGTVLDADLVVAATGRRPRTSRLNLEAVGVETDASGAIVVDEDFCSSVPGIYAIGDVTGGITLTPVATKEGHWLAARWFADEPLPRVEYDNIPTAVFSKPNVGTVGMSERDARRKGHRLAIYRSSFRGLANMVSGIEERTLLKLVVDADTDAVLGLHMAGPQAGEVVQGFAVALKAGATKADFDRTIGIHPTVAEEFVTLRQPVHVDEA